MIICDNCKIMSKEVIDSCLECNDDLCNECAYEDNTDGHIFCKKHYDRYQEAASVQRTLLKYLQSIMPQGFVFKDHEVDGDAFTINYLFRKIKITFHVTYDKQHHIMDVIANIDDIKTKFSIDYMNHEGCKKSFQKEICNMLDEMICRIDKQSKTLSDKKNKLLKMKKIYE